MADKFFHEFPPTSILKDTSILLLDQDNQTTAITLAQLKSFLGTGGGGGTNTYTTVGNASAGIFVAAKCYVNGEKGSWVAPAGCYTARVTVVGGGGSSGGNGAQVGGRSHFNYPSGSSPSLNQLFANGGSFGYGTSKSTNKGGDAGWNNIVVTGGNGGVSPSYGTLTGGFGGNGKIGNGGVGGGGGGAGSPGQLGGGAGGLNGDGANGGSTDGSGLSYISNSSGGGIIQLSTIATSLPKFISAINANVGKGGTTTYTGYSNGAGGGWCTAMVNVIPGNSYSYAAGIGGPKTTNVPSVAASYGMVVIEW
jgi:hypothetical protein